MKFACVYITVDYLLCIFMCVRVYCLYALVLCNIKWFVLYIYIYMCVCTVCMHWFYVIVNYSHSNYKEMECKINKYKTYLHETGEENIKIKGLNKYKTYIHEKWHHYHADQDTRHVADYSVWWLAVKWNFAKVFSVF
jgi:hypothetical protein